MVKVGDKVKVGGKPGVVTEVCGDQCSVRLDGRPKKPDGADADHEADTLGCVPVASLEVEAPKAPAVVEAPKEATAFRHGGRGRRE